MELNIQKAGDKKEYLQLYSIKEVSQMTHVAESTLRGWILNGKMPHTKVGGCVRMTMDDIKSVMDRRN